MAAALGLGYASRRWMFPPARRTLRGWGLTPAGIRVVLLLWEALPFGTAVMLGGANGWRILYVRKGKVWGGCLAALAFVLGYLLCWFFERNKEV